MSAVTVNPTASVGRRRRPGGWGRAVRSLLLIVSLAVVLIPVYVLVITSFKNGAEADPSSTWFLPEHWDTSNW